MKPLETVDQPGSLISPAAGAYNSLEQHLVSGTTISMEIAADGAMAFLAVQLAFYLYARHSPTALTMYPGRTVSLFSWLFAFIVVVLLKWAGDYRPYSSMLRVKETERLLFSVAGASVLTFVLVRILNNTAPILWMSYSMLVASLGMFSHRQLLHCILQSLLTRGYMATNVAIYGAGASGQRVFSALIGSPKLGLRPIAFFDDDESLWGTRIYESAYRKTAFAPVQSGVPSSAVLRQMEVKALIVAIPQIDRVRLLTIIQEAAQADISVQFTAPSFEEGDYSMGYLELDGHILSYVTGQTAKPFYQLAKRAFDTLVSLCLLVCLSPLLLLIALTIRATSKGPIIFRQERIGENGRPFTMYKFRSMYTDRCGDAHSPDSGVDPRITPAGRILRRVSLDELPQLFNILRGEMSLVGPRPEMPFIVKTYTPQQRRRLSVIPGLTGLWQISADRSAQIHQNIHYDLYYIRNRGFFLDMAILLHTVFVAMRGI